MCVYAAQAAGTSRPRFGSTIFKRTALTVTRRRNRWSARVHAFFESPIAQIAEDRAGSLERIVRQHLFHLGIDAARRQEDVREPVITQINDVGAPAGEADLETRSRSGRSVFEIRPSIRSVQDVRFVREVRFEDIEVSSQIVAAHNRSHPGLFQSIFIERDSQFHSFPEKVSSWLWRERIQGLTMP